VERTVQEAVQAFEDGGAIVEEVTMQSRHSALELGDLWCRLMVPSSIVRVENLRRAGIDLRKDHPHDLAPEILYWIDQVNTQTVVEAEQDRQMRTTVFDAVQQVFESYDLLLTPTLACLPVDNGTDGNTLGPAEINGEAINRLIGWCLTFPLNFTGHPAASVPAGLIEDRWPVGLQIIGKRFDDASVMRASAYFEAARPWQKHYERLREGMQSEG
jgi:amidase/aspartyl-tRNA(Asn)/glutamyl-tRNA(Gln) amidotransferase subunit A